MGSKKSLHLSRQFAFQKMDAGTFLAIAKNGGRLHFLEGELPTQMRIRKSCSGIYLFRNVLFIWVGNSPSKKVDAKTFLANRPDEQIRRHQVDFSDFALDFLKWIWDGNLRSKKVVV